MPDNHIEHGGFTSSAAKGRMRAPRYIGGVIQSSARHNAKRIRARRTGPSSMFLKLGLCAAACAAVLLVKWLGTPAPARAAGSVRQAIEEETQLGELLGRLHFVELPGIVEVFSATAQPELGVDYETALRDEDTMVVTLALDHVQYLAVPVACKVKTIGEDAALGHFVSVLTKDDHEITYYGLQDISVEEGQRLLAKDTIARVDSKVAVSVHAGGRPTDPAIFFRLNANPPV
ncbi:MAG: M23 family metallopeptidase [Christensenellaceae bacterium]|jgi:hypothetical protein|nr:M23 family metallopeptidase [Christensenellaceae bacterium]